MIASGAVYARSINNLRRLRRAVDLEAAIDDQRVYWKVLGIMAMLMIGLMVAAVLVGFMMSLR
jgi:hypothetical protein